jgi:phytoene/squalene synthetase
LDVPGDSPITSADQLVGKTVGLVSDRDRAIPRSEVQDIVAASGSSFTTAIKFLPRERRDAMFAIYAFCRLVDDITDGQGFESEKLVALNEWSDEIARTYQRTPSTALGEELARAIDRIQLPRREFDLILTGMRMDVEAPGREMDRDASLCLSPAAGN